MRKRILRTLSAAAALSATVAGHAALPADTGIAWNLNAAQVANICRTRLAQVRAQVKQLDAQSDPVDFAHGIGALEAATADFGDALAAPTALADIAVDKDVRDASRQCRTDAEAFGNELSADPALLRFAESARAEVTTDADRALADHYIEAGRRAGAGLDATRRKQVTALFDQLSKVQNEFQAGLGEDRPTIEINRAEAASLPADFVRTLKAKGGGYLVNVDESTYFPFMKNETAGAARKRFAVAYGRHGGEANVRRLATAVRLRDRIAHLLGFPSWDAYKLDASMAKTPERPLDLLQQIDAALLPKARQEVDVLAQLKRAGGDASPFAPWDYLYFENQLEKSHYAVDPEAVRRYFPIPKVIAAVLGIYQHLLGVRFDPIDPAAAWAPGVLEYAISDAADGHDIGWFYLDLYPRTGKYTHFATAPLRAARVLPDGSYEKPVAAILGNWPVGEPGKPALLSHGDVVTFFHEFGHLMHDTLTAARYATLSGTNVRWDFVEAPSQMLENWIWDPAVLKKVSSEVDTGAPLPDELIDKMIALRHVADGATWSRQAFYATYDLDLHSAAGPTRDPTRLWFDLSVKMTPFAAIPGTIPEAGFGHLMAGYDAGYYGYAWSEVFAQDMFSVFQQAGLEDPTVGMRYRRDILEPGGTIEPDQLLRNFLGRPVSYEPFYRFLNITPPK
jgi:Zn-dependent oligopeptidase